MQVPRHTHTHRQAGTQASMHTHKYKLKYLIMGSSVHGDIPLPWAVTDSLSSTLKMTEKQLPTHTHLYRQREKEKEGKEKTEVNQEKTIVWF